MNVTKLATLSVAAMALIGAVSQAAQAQGKTRAQVHQELVQAQHDGVIPNSKTQYPPSADRVARNKELHALSWHAGEKSPPVDHHDTFAAR
ncbi:DUF4148 domain-containing protein [Paraburkholderia aromaticivorans]|uniref:DUF4148 domain-containing protein n=1 Tax=Paraburkholderia aromaticivorans TaxID=2026199 RepID=A0A248VRF0_9BURK|nr:DUF4148 domain-containing protein [Paraburkholderia aromaticivorans]ASW01571.1 hypothetical protein CJU94_25750 [Paraburkholderia aromaticivorans]